MFLYCLILPCIFFRMFTFLLIFLSYPVLMFIYLKLFNYLYFYSNFTPFYMILLFIYLPT